MNIWKKNKKQLLTLFIVLIGFGFSMEAQVCFKDTIQRASLDSTQNTSFDNSVSAQMDSLLNLWYVKQSIKANSEKFVPLSTEGISYSDSIYAKRLSEIPSVIPLSYNKEVRSYIEMYCIRKRKLAGVIIGLSKYYFPMYEEIMEQNGVPQELKYLSIIESALNPNAVSCVGATGLWQFMFSTGRMYGLEVNTFVDARKDPIRATNAAARYLSDLHKIYNDWTLAIAAYNCGPGNVSKAIRRSGGKTDFWQIYYYLPKETRGYVPAFIAAAYMMNYYDKHNISVVPITMPTLTDTVVVNKEVHLQQVAAVLNLPIEELRALNPQYKRDIVPAYKDAYPLILPPLKAIDFTSLRDSIHNYNYTTYFTPMQVVDIDSQNNNPALNTARLNKKYHLVKSGETLGSISKKYGISSNEIKYLNKIRGKSVAPGRKIVVGFYPVEKNLAKANDTTKLLLAVTDSNKTLLTDTLRRKINRPVAQKYRYYKVVPGDTIWSIAKKFPGITHLDILNNNKLKEGHIEPGQVLKIPKG
jgi:membrane-bound lytic murein transglycosylase D